MYAHFALFCRSTLISAHNNFSRPSFLFFLFGPCAHDANILFLSPVILLGILTCSSVLAASSLLLLLCFPLTKIHCSIFIFRWLMLAAIPILRRSLLVYPRSLLADYDLCRCSLLISRFLLVFTLYTLLIATHMRSRQKKGRPTRQFRIFKNSKTKKSTQCRQLQEKKVSFNKKKSMFYEKKSRPFVGKFQKSKKMVCKKKSWPYPLGRLPRMCTHCTSSCSHVVVR